MPSTGVIASNIKAGVKAGKVIARIYIILPRASGGKLAMDLLLFFPPDPSTYTYIYYIYTYTCAAGVA